jgi:rod shape-determining protein MreD
MTPDRSPVLQPGIQPRSSLWRRLDVLSRRGLPGVLTGLAVLLLSAPFDLPGQAELLPGMVLSSVFFWSVFRPASMPSPVVFLLGLLVDLLGFGPPGVMLLVLLVVHGVGLSGRYGFARIHVLLLWLVFGGVSLGGTILQWGLVSALSLRVMPGSAFVFQWTLGLGVFPVLYVLFAAMSRTIANPDRA